MDALVMMVLVLVGYIIMYRLYGRFIGQKIFALAKDRLVPAKEFEDGVDFVPTKKEVIFGHHYASIAGTGPIVGPAIAVIWGWLPAIIWIFVGSIVIGAVHDFGALVLSMRNQGKSISEYTKKYINPRTGLMFFVIVFMELWIFIAILGLVMAVIFAKYPAAVFPVWMEIPIAIYLGYLVYKKGKSILGLSILAIIAMYVTVIIGVYMPINLPVIAGIPPTGGWTLILLTYAFIASVLPVTTLLQPRDFINSHQLVVAMVLLVGGVLVAGFSGQMEIVAPAVQATPEGAPPMWPFLFITIACGAISGFHALVSSGTTSKQVESEQDALVIGYGGMLMEGVLSTLVVVAATAGIGMGYEADGQLLSGTAAWTQHYASWAAAAGLASKIGAFVDGGANMISTLGVPVAWAVAIMGVFVASFAGTSLDTATRIQRYISTELFTRFGVGAFRNIYVSTAFAVISAAILAFVTGADGKGALKLWPLFGAINQSLAALGLVVMTVYLKSKGGGKWVFSAVPAAFMIVMTMWAAIMNQIKFLGGSNILLIVSNSVIILIVAVIAFEGVVKFMSTSPDASGPGATASSKS
ncbi:carbon starvation CstA family protein [Desulfoplanes sp.]